MKNFVKAGVMGVVLMGSSAAMAECPVALPYEKLMDCIVEEGAGGEYPVEKVLKEMNKQQAESKQGHADEARTADDV